MSIISKAQTGLYNQTIFTDKIEDERLKQSVNDLKIYLEKITGKVFTIKESEDITSFGIIIKTIRPGFVSDQQYKKLQSGTIEDFVFSSNNKQLFITANHTLGLSYGIYTFLDMLGVKWYFPGEEWEYVPQQKNINLSIEKYFSPSFHVRNFFGTGGIAPVPSIDAKANLQKLWEDWKRRNRFGGEVQLGGHYGEAFNNKYKEIFFQHPEYLAMINGKRQAWTPSTKLCISNAEVRKLYINDRIAEAKATLTKSPNGFEKITISVDPSDGGSDCECDQCKKMGSASERDFFLANEVAKEFEKISPRLYANIYAYNTHAAAPSFALSSHLIVQVVPYAFQRVSSPEELISSWQKKSGSLLLYDYYGIPDWSYNLPLSQTWALDQYIKKIIYWYSLHIRGFVLESSYSIGGNGLGLYLASRLGWNINTDIEKQKNEFYENMFGNSITIKKFFKKISSDFNGSPDVAFLMQQLEQANIESKNKFEDRIGDWQGYLHYLLLYYEFQNADVSSKKTKWEDLISFTWRVYPNAMIHSTRLSELFCARFGIPQNIVADWDLHNTNSQKLNQISFMSAKEIKTIAESDRKNNPFLKDFFYNTSKKDRFILKSSLQRDEKPDDGLMILEFPETYVQPGTDGTVQFWVKTNETSQNNDVQNIIIELIDTASNLTIQKKQLTINKKWMKILFSLPDKRTYKINIQNTNWIRFYSAPSQWLAFKNIPVHAVMGKLWIYIPENTGSLYYNNTSAEQPVFKTSDGKVLTSKKINDQNIYQVDFKSSPFVQFLSMESSEYKYLQFFAMPALFFPYPVYSLQR